jgi:dipeptidyl aminopeptidase/acylaminoacyl peptidase
MGPAGLAAAVWTPQSYPPWYRVVIWFASSRAMTSPQVRIWGNPCWSLTGELAVTAFDGIRRGIVTIDPSNGTTRWWSRPVSASYRLLALAPGGQDALAVRCDHDGSAWLVRAVRGGADQRLQLLRRADQVPVRVVTWMHDGITLEGLLAVPPGAGPHPLLVMLHGGPVGGLACGEHPDLSPWVLAGLAVFLPDYRASGIAGADRMMEAFRRPWLPAADPEAGDVLAGVDVLTAAHLADPRALFLLGHSYGGYLAGRIVTRDHRFRAAACCEAVADLRVLDPVSQQVQAAWLGGDARQSPSRWAAASPTEHAREIRTPMLLVYAADGGLTAQGEAWHAALAAARVTHKLVILDDADHMFSSPDAQWQLRRELADWFEYETAS